MKNPKPILQNLLVNILLLHIFIFKKHRFPLLPVTSSE